MLHIHCGDSSADTLRQAGIAGEVMVWCELFTWGPVPAGVTDAEWYRLRGAALSESTGGALTPEQCGRRLTRQDQALARSGEHEEVVLWFDACLYDQLTLVRQLDWFAQRDLPATRLSLICVGEFPGFAKFRGLGELNSGQLASLLETRHEVETEELRLGARAWAAFRASDPAAVAGLASGDTTALPYLGDALRRHLEQFPAADTGLDRLERQALEVVAAGATGLGPIFVQVSDREERPYFGDGSLWHALDRLAHEPTPLLAVDGPGPLPLWDPPRDLSPWRVGITEAGRAVLAGRRNRIALNGFDRWLGGVHVACDHLWCWDGRRLVRR